MCHRIVVTRMDPHDATAAPLSPVASSHDRLDRELLTDLRRVAKSRALIGFLVLDIVAAAVLVLRRGEALLATVAVVWAGLLCVAFMAWWAGRHRLAVQEADEVPAPAMRAAAALVGALGLLIAGLGAWQLGAPVFVVGLLAWVLVGFVARRSGGPRGAGWRQLARDPRPFVPLLLLVGLTRVLFAPVEPVGLVAALVSGIVQQVAYLVGLFGPLEAVRGRSDVAAVLAALVFGAVHLPFDVAPNGGDQLAAAANAVVFQASVGLVATLAFVRHRAAVPIGLAHGLAIA